MRKNSSVSSSLLQRDSLAVFIVIVNAFSWYFPLYLFFENISKNFQMGSTFLYAAFGVQCATAAGFAIVGTVLVKKIQSRDTFLSFWMFIGIIASVSMIMLEISNTVYILLVSSLLGASLGLGFPSCLAYFGDHSVVENRGWLAGTVFFASCMCMFFIGFLLNSSSLVTGALILAAWRAIGLFLFLLARTKNHRKENTIEVSYRSFLLERSFLLYIVPWTMFCLINFLEAPLLTNFFGTDFSSFVPISEYGIGGFVALIGGWFADSVGRKPVIIFGFIMLGIGYGLLGLFPSPPLSWYLYLILDGIAWGIFSIVFYLVIWSDLAGNRNKEKYYLVGVLPFLIASYIQVLFTPYAGEVQGGNWAAFSLASFFLFIAVLPLLIAPETMPQKQIELKRLKKFADDAKKAREKYERKMAES